MNTDWDVVVVVVSVLVGVVMLAFILSRSVERRERAFIEAGFHEVAMLGTSTKCWQKVPQRDREENR